MADFDSLVVSMRSSRSAPRMPFRAAYTGTPCARAASITPAAVALITAVTPPDWAYSRRPEREAGLMAISLVGTSMPLRNSDLARIRLRLGLTLPGPDGTLTPLG